MSREKRSKRKKEKEEGKTEIVTGFEQHSVPTVKKKIEKGKGEMEKADYIIEELPEEITEQIKEAETKEEIEEIAKGIGEEEARKKEYSYLSELEEEAFAGIEASQEEVEERVKEKLGHEPRNYEERLEEKKMREKIRAEKIRDRLREMDEEGKLEGKRIYVQSGLMHSPLFYKELKKFSEGKENIEIKRKNLRGKDLEERGVSEKYQEIFPPGLQYERMAKHNTPTYRKLKELEEADESEKSIEEYYRDKYKDKEKNWEEELKKSKKASEKIEKIQDREEVYRRAKEGRKRELMNKGMSEGKADYKAGLDILSKMWKVRKGILKKEKKE